MLFRQMEIILAGFSSSQEMGKRLSIVDKELLPSMKSDKSAGKRISSDLNSPRQATMKNNQNGRE